MSEFIETAKKLGFVMLRHCVDDTEVTQSKQIVQASYSHWGTTINKTFLNWGLWDKSLYQEYKNLDFNFSQISTTQNIYSQLLLYFLIRPLIQRKLINKRLLEVGSGNGLGLKASSILLQTDYALGIDLSNQLVANARGNFSHKDKINYIQGDAEHLPLENECFDIITNMESSHIYPRVESFIEEVGRVLAPNGYFCYADVEMPNKAQSQLLEQYIEKNKRLKIIQKINITKLVQASIYQRVLFNENDFYNMAINFFGEESERLLEEVLLLAYSMGLSFLPWWKIRFKNKDLRYIAKSARRDKFWGKKYYFYYLIQKSN